MSERFEAGGYPVEVLYLDNHLLGVVKPANLPVQRDASGDEDLLSAAKAFIARRYEKPGAAYLGLVQRLDRPVGGVMVLARTSKAASRLSRAFLEHALDKQYLAVLQGSLEGERTLVDFLRKDERTGMVEVAPEGSPGAKRAQLTTRAIACRQGLTLAQVTLMTGRAHQIRVQHAHAGYPLWGDARYGGGRPGQQIALWAWRLRFEHPVSHQTVSLQAPPPGDGAWALFKRELECFHES